ncbi:MFS transporter [Amnibacterium setariae]|uniref:MFS transporter n=1 Tax=Amnibacterium setariae TaxID=2306585 RepID=A0A3A1UBG3_9MICO|nr:MFS transporter [Amnibacterium setariae]RIX30646.1 MFS transporter [Amnibacterium setariae]
MSHALPLSARIRPAFSGFAPLSIPNYRRFAGSNVLAMSATWMQRIAQDWLVLQLTHSVAAVGVTTAMQFAPSILFGLHGGVVVDRFPRRKLLMVTQSLVGAVSLLLAITALTHTATVWFVWAAAFAIGCVTVVDNPGRQVFVNELVGRQHLKNALNLNAAVFQLGAFVGPAVAGGLIGAVGGGWAFLINAAACCVTVFMLTRLDPAQLQPVPVSPRRPHALREGIAFVLRTPAIRYSILMLAFLSVFTLTMPVLLAAFATQVFDLGASGYGLFNSLVAIGAVAGALASTRLTRLRLRIVVLCGTAWAGTLALAAFMPTVPTFGVALVASGIGSQYFFQSGNPLVQLSTVPEVRGRVISVWVLVVLGGQGIGGPIMGGIVDAIGARGGMLVAGGVPLVAGIVLSLLLARRGSLRLAVSSRRPLVAITER